MAGHGWNAKTNIECEYKRFLGNVLTPLSAWGVKFTTQIDLPRLIELTVGEDITSYGCGNFGADLFVCTKCKKISRGDVQYLSVH